MLRVWRGWRRLTTRTGHRRWLAATDGTGCRYPSGFFGQLFGRGIHYISGGDGAGLLRLIRALEHDLLHSNMVRTTARYAKEKRIDAEFYTDSWPHFTTVVGRIFRPRLSDEADLIYYSHSKETLLRVLMEPGIISWGKWQKIIWADEDHSDYLIENLRPTSNSCQQRYRHLGHEQMLFYSARVDLKYSNAEIDRAISRIHSEIPEGLVLGALRPCHTDQLVQHAKSVYTSRDSTQTYTYYTEIINNLPTLALYTAVDPHVPIAWVFEHPHGHIGVMYAQKDYRRQNLGSLLGGLLGLEIHRRGDIAQTFIAASNTASIQHTKNNGMFKVGAKEILVTTF